MSPTALAHLADVKRQVATYVRDTRAEGRKAVATDWHSPLELTRRFSWMRPS